MTVTLLKDRLYRVGVDVGGTNTDAALACWTPSVDGSQAGSKAGDIKIIASHKSQTTPDVTTGIRKAIEAVLTSAAVPHDAVVSVNIGTTHFINAVVQADPASLSRVAVLRLCGPFCREVPSFADFPGRLRGVLEGYTAYLDGGLEIDGRYIKNINETEVVRHAQEIKRQGISAVAVVGVFSPVDVSDVSQEEQVKRILQREIPNVDVVCSRDIGRVGFVERENASILNASILKFARRTIRGFQKAILDLKLLCPLYLTQNDGTAMDAETARSTPIKTFSSGATNSLTGALFLADLQHNPDIDLKSCQVIMADIGGTTSDFAALSPSGFPRQASAAANIAGVRTAYSMPEVVSIGLGGGSLVHFEDGSSKVSVGPLSVGHRLLNEARCFGGDKLTATDIAVAKGYSDDSLPGWKADISSDLVDRASRDITVQLQRCVDTMKTSDLDVVLLLVGGGSIIQMEPLTNVRSCIRPPFYKVANAVGAAIAKVSGEIDRIIIPGDRTYEEIMRDLKLEAVELAYHNGARAGSAEVMEIDMIPLQYVSNNAVRAVVKAVGELAWKHPTKVQDPVKMKVEEVQLSLEAVEVNCQDGPLPHHTNFEKVEIDLETYIPNVSRDTGEWFLSETDLMFIAEGCGILGTGGGGSVYTGLLHSQEVLRMAKQGRMRIIEVGGLPPKSYIGAVAFAGAPSVSNERLINGNEMELASQDLSRFLGIPGYDAMMAAEVGGSNGMRAFAAAASLDIPVVDADMMGRAFPKVDMALPYIYGQASPAPAVLSDARGNVQIIASVEDSHRFESIIRSACVELGLYTALSLAPLQKEVVENYCCLGSLSFAWFMGREMCLARQRKQDVIQALLAVTPGGKLLYTGKVIEVRREVKGGWTIGTTTLEPLRDEESNGETENSNSPKLVLGYQNEFFSATLLPDTVLCTTPDLLTVVDADTGTALATHELRYGLRVAVIAMPAHPLWSSEASLKMAGPEAFGLSGSFKPLGTNWASPPSVFERYGK